MVTYNHNFKILLGLIWSVKEINRTQVHGHDHDQKRLFIYYGEEKARCMSRWAKFRILSLWSIHIRGYRKKGNHACKSIQHKYMLPRQTRNPWGVHCLWLHSMKPRALILIRREKSMTRLGSFPSPLSLSPTAVSQNSNNNDDDDEVQKSKVG